MAKARNRLADLLSGWSKGLFNWLTRHEEYSEFARRIKLPLLGLFVILIGWISTGAICWNSCYLPIQSEPIIEEASVEPNPTKGSDTVTVRAEPRISYDPEERAYSIEKGICILNGDTTEMELTKDGFHGPGKHLRIKLYVGDLDLGTNYIRIEVFNDIDEMADTTLKLNVTEEK
ncbi:hypothetical protein JXM67_12655 [candidate division WOR-3 bacterium]|nr:hypothetical protein [candidate division WOR-3 bacterium]